MEIALLPQQTLRLKSKYKTILFDPEQLKAKTTADAIVLSQPVPNAAFPQVEGSQLLIQGAGEYEIGGVTITGYRNKGDIVYTVLMDGVSVLVASDSGLISVKDQLTEYDVAIIHAKGIVDQTIISSLSAHLLIFTGEKALENCTASGVEAINPVNKIVTTKDKLPTDHQTILLG